MPVSIPRRRALQWATLMPLSACVSMPEHVLEGRHATLSPDGQRLHLVLDVAREQRVYSYPRDYTQVLSRQILTLDVPARPAYFETREILKRGRLLAGPDPKTARGRFSVQQGHALLAQDDLQWCRLEPEGGCTTLGRIERPLASEPHGHARWLLGDEGRFVLTPERMVDITRTQTLLHGWATRPGYRAFAAAVQAKDPLSSQRRTPEGLEYTLHLVEGRWLLALLPLHQTGTRLWAYAYDLLEDHMSAWAQDPHAARCRHFAVHQAARLGSTWQLWLRSNALWLGGGDCGRTVTSDAVLDKDRAQLWPLPADTPKRLNVAMAKVWDPAQRRILVLEADGPEQGFGELPTRLRVDELRY
jgi:hypothetical protein